MGYVVKNSDKVLGFAVSVFACALWEKSLYSFIRFGCNLYTLKNFQLCGCDLKDSFICGGSKYGF